MNTVQMYAGKGNYASPTTPTVENRPVSSPPADSRYFPHFRAQTSALVAVVARQAGQRPATVYKRLYDRLLALYGVDLYGYPKGRRTSWLKVAERYDVLDKVYLLAQVERLHYSPTC